MTNADNIRSMNDEKLAETVVLCKRCGKAPAIDPANKRMVCPDCLRDLRWQRDRIMKRIKEEQRFKEG